MDVLGQITSTAQTYGVDPRLAYEVALEESRANPDAPDGAAGEIGMFQLKPSTAAMLGVNPRDPVQNIIGGVKYLAMLLGQFSGDAAKAVAAYNAGPTAVTNAIALAGDNWFGQLPGSTQGYVNAILTGANEGYSAAPGGDAFSSAVGGISLSTVAWIIGAAVFALLAFDAADF